LGTGRQVKDFPVEGLKITALAQALFMTDLPSFAFMR
jgi:hypothetical protein